MHPTKQSIAYATGLGVDVRRYVRWLSITALLGFFLVSTIGAYLLWHANGTALRSNSRSTVHAVNQFINDAKKTVESSQLLIMDQEQDLLRATIFNLLEKQNNISSFHIITYDDGEMIDLSAEFGMPLTQIIDEEEVRNFFQRVDHNQYALASFLRDEALPFYLLASTTYYSDSQSPVYITAVLNTLGMIQLASKLSEPSKNTICIASKEGVILVHPILSNIGAQLTFYHPFEKPLFNNIHIIKNPEGKLCFSSALSIPESDWVAFSIQPISNWVLAWPMLSLILVSIVIWLVIRVNRFTKRQIVTPLTTLKFAVEKYRIGELNHQVALKGKDELSELGRTLNDMAGSLSTTLEELKSKNEQLLRQIAVREEAEEKLREREIRYRNLFENSPISLWEEDFSKVKEYLVDLHKTGVVDFRDYFRKNPEEVARCARLIKVVDVNKATLELLEAKHKEELLAGPKIFTEESLKIFEEELITLAGGGLVFSAETVQRTFNEIEKLVSLHLSVAPGYEDSLGKVLVSLLDITDRKHAEEELKKHRDHLEELIEERTIELHAAKEKAEVANQAKSTFLASMSHELRTPLNAVLGYAQILNRHKLEPKIIDSVKIIQQSGEHLLTMINDILDISKIEAGKMELFPAQLHLSAFLRQIVGIIDARAEIKNLSLSYEALSPLPEGVVTDEHRLRQVLLNLLGNAVKFTEQGHVTLTVKEIEEEPIPENDSDLTTLRFAVEDTGCGISEDQIERIFLPFEQVGEMGRRAEGTGLGLAISRRILQLMDSKLQVKSELGRGSTFWFEITMPTIETIASLQPVSTSQIVGYLGARHKILVADDKSYNRSVLREMLEPLGFEVHTVNDGKQAVEAASVYKPEAIILDIVMPVMTGIEAASEIRSMVGFEDTLIVAVSASVLEADRQRSFISGCNAFLPKPVNMMALLNLMQTHLNITWSFSDDSSKDDATGGTIVAPNQEKLTELYQAADLGKVSEIHNIALDLKNEDTRFDPFVSKLQELAKGFEMEKIMDFVEQLMEKHNDLD